MRTLRTHVSHTHRHKLRCMRATVALSFAVRIVHACVHIALCVCIIRSPQSTSARVNLSSTCVRYAERPMLRSALDARNTKFMHMYLDLRAPPPVLAERPTRREPTVACVSIVYVQLLHTHKQIMLGVKRFDLIQFHCFCVSIYRTMSTTSHINIDNIVRRAATVLLRLLLLPLLLLLCCFFL